MKIFHPVRSRQLFDPGYNDDETDGRRRDKNGGVQKERFN
jgi:hypothetical protein